MGRLDGKTAWVTGGASGIGAAIVLRFLEEGARVVVTDLNPLPDSQFDALAPYENDIRYYPLDVSDRVAVATTADCILTDTGPVDILVNSAGIGPNGSATTTSHENWQHTLDVNLSGTFFCCRAVLPSMVSRETGAIINIASIMGLASSDRSLAYCVSKGGVAQLTRSIAIDYGLSGIRCNALAPGFVDTPIVAGTKHVPTIYRRIIDYHAMGRIGQPREIANAALFLASDESSFVTGHILTVDGGYSAGRKILSQKGADSGLGDTV